MDKVNTNSEDVLSFCKPWISRIGYALFALVLAGGYPALLALSGSKAPMNALGWVCFSFLEMIILPFATFFLFLAGPQHLSFDLNRRTYRYVFGWPFKPQAQEGSWEDIAGVYIRDRNRSRLSGYSVGIAWKDIKVA